jgi:hypothetical protein
LVAFYFNVSRHLWVVEGIDVDPFCPSLSLFDTFPVALLITFNFWIPKISTGSITVGIVHLKNISTAL